MRQGTRLGRTRKILSWQNRRRTDERQWPTAETRVSSGSVADAVTVLPVLLTTVRRPTCFFFLLITSKDTWSAAFVVARVTNAPLSVRADDLYAYVVSASFFVMFGAVSALRRKSIRCAHSKAFWRACWHSGICFGTDSKLRCLIGRDRQLYVWLYLVR